MPILNADDLGGVPIDPVSPGASVPVKFDFAALTNGNGATNWLNSGEQVATAVVSADTELAISDETLEDTSTSKQFFVNPATDIVEGDYEAECTVTTNSVPPRVQVFTMIVPVYQK